MAAGSFANGSTLSGSFPGCARAALAIQNGGVLGNQASLDAAYVDPLAIGLMQLRLQDRLVLHVDLGVHADLDRLEQLGFLVVV